MRKNVVLSGILALVCMTTGCTMTSDSLLQEIRQTEQKKGQGDMMTAITNIHRKLELPDKVEQSSEDILSQAWMKAETPYEKRFLIRIAAINEQGRGRYIPFLYYVASTDTSMKNRVLAASVFGGIEYLNPAISPESIILLLGSLAEEGGEYQERVLFYLEEFLLKVCRYSIPDGDRKPRILLLGSDAMPCRMEVDRSNPEIVIQWWLSKGKELVRNREFSR